MKKTIILLLLVVLLSACSALLPTPLDVIKPKSGIDVDAQVGKTNQMEDSLISIKGEGSSQTADSITNTDIARTNANQINNTNIPWWVALMVAFMRPVVILGEIMDIFRRKK